MSEFMSDKDLLEISIETDTEFKDQYNTVKEILIENNFSQELYFPNQDDTNNFNFKETYGNLLFKKKK